MGCRQFTNQFRELAVSNALAGKVSISALAGIYGIAPSTLYRWAADSGRRPAPRGKAVLGQNAHDPFESIKFERDAYRLVALCLARELSSKGD